MSGVCDRCEWQGKFPSEGDQPKCAFPEGVFVTDNWMCGTTRALRHVILHYQNMEEPWPGANPGAFESDGQQAGVVPLRDGVDWQDFIVLSWYKRRGRTEGAWMIGEDRIEPLTEEVAKRVLEHHLPLITELR